MDRLVVSSIATALTVAISMSTATARADEPARSLTMHDAIVLALAHNPDSRSTEEDVASAGGVLEQSKVLPNPSLVRLPGRRAPVAAGLARAEPVRGQLDDSARRQARAPASSRPRADASTAARRDRAIAARRQLELDRLDPAFISGAARPVAARLREAGPARPAPGDGARRAAQQGWQDRVQRCPEAAPARSTDDRRHRAPGRALARERSRRARAL